MFALGMGSTLHVRLCDAEVVTHSILRMIYPRQVSSQEVIGKDNHKGYVRREGQETIC